MNQGQCKNKRILDEDKDDASKVLLFSSTIGTGGCAELCAGGTLFIETRTTTVRGGGTMRTGGAHEHLQQCSGGGETVSGVICEQASF